MANSTAELRNPYVLLGVAFGASRDVATAAFSKKARALRRAPDGQERLTELTWALNQVQEVLKDPRAALEVYRVPADPGAFVPDAVGLLDPGPIRLGRRHESSWANQSELLNRALGEALACAAAELASTSTVIAR